MKINDTFLNIEQATEIFIKLKQQGTLGFENKCFGYLYRSETKNQWYFSTTYGSCQLDKLTVERLLLGNHEIKDNQNPSRSYDDCSNLSYTRSSMSKVNSAGFNKLSKINFSFAFMALP